MVDVKKEIENALEEYKKKQNIFRKFAWHHHCIRHLTKLKQEIGYCEKLSNAEWYKLFDILANRHSNPRGVAEEVLNELTKRLFGFIDADQELKDRRVNGYPRVGIVQVFEALANANLLTPQNVNDVNRAYNDSENLITILKIFANTHLLSDEQFSKIRGEGSLYKYKTAFGLLKAKNCLTPQNIDAVMTCPDLGIAFDELEKADILTDENRSVLLKHKDPITLARALVCQKKADIEETNELIIGHPHPQDLALAYSYLKKANIKLDPETKEALKSHPDTSAISTAFVRLSWRNLLTEDFVKKILSHRAPAGPGNLIEMSFYTLAAYNIMSVDNANAVLAYPMPSYLAEIFVVLSRFGLLSPENRQAWGTVPYQVLCDWDVSNCIRFDIPRHLFTQQLNDRLIQIACDATVPINNRKQNLLAYVNLVLNNPQGLGINQIDARPQQRNTAQNTLNYAQSIHADSVHKSASTSAIKLKQLYGGNLNIDATLQEMNQWINSLGNDDQAAAAKRAFPVIRTHQFTDRASGVTTPQLLALIWRAIHDDSMRASSLNEAKNILIEAFYEYQRGYNLDVTGKDMGGIDHEICVGGTFNKLLEKLQYVHPAVEILFITKGTASVKLPIIVREQAAKYLLDMQKNANTPETQANFDKLLNQFQEEGITSIYQMIKKDVFTLFFDEFKSVWGDNQNDTDLIATVDAGEYTAVEFMDKFFSKHKIAIFKPKEIPLDEIELEIQASFQDESKDDLLADAKVNKF